QQLPAPGLPAFLAGNSAAAAAVIGDFKILHRNTKYIIRQEPSRFLFFIPKDEMAGINKVSEMIASAGVSL
ncbi:MAG: hypothetical protein QHH02_07345, partial [Syntrophomonadaceae bacterium]|nr:hypothetical protein [Syntrophomonadaceae bacterium]